MSVNRDESILTHIVRYCDQVAEAIGIFGNEYTIFLSNNTYKNACCLCLLQIGELVGTLSAGFTTSHTEIPWKQIKGFRNIVAHAYGTIEPEIVWDIISNDLPRLKDYCKTCISNFQEPAWDPDFTKLTPDERARLESSEDGEYIDSDDIDWNN